MSPQPKADKIIHTANRPVKTNQLAMRLVEGTLPLDKRRLDAVITTLLLTVNQDLDEDWALLSRCLAGIREGRYRLDSKLVLAMYDLCDENEKVELASLEVVNRLPPPAFKRIFNEVYARSDLSDAQRKALAWTLEAFLWRLPEQVPEFEPVILGLLRSPRPILRLRALIMAGMLRRLEDRDLAIVKKSLRAKAPGLRVNALAGLCIMTEHRESLDLRLRTFLASGELRQAIQQLRRSDPAKTVRDNASSLQRRLLRSPERASFGMWSSLSG